MAHPGHAQSSDQGSSTQTAQAGAAINEITVTGSRIARTGFSSPTPVTVLDNNYLQSLGIVDVGQAVNELPAFKASLTPETNGWGSFNVGAQRADLRGLGPTRSLVLVDGRRFVPSTNQGDVDMSLIPSILMERTEVVTGGASAAYGSDALAGVVNIILNKELTGMRLNADYGASFQGDGSDYHVSFAGGSDFAKHGHFIIGGEYENAGGIGTCYEHNGWCNDNPGLITNLGNATNGQPRYIRTNNVVLANATPGGVIVGAANPVYGGPPLAFPAGSTIAGPDADHLWQFDDSGQPVPYAKGQYASFTQLGGDGESLLHTANVRVPYTRYTIFGHADYDLSSTTQAFFEASYGHTKGSNLGAATWWTQGNAVTAQRDNPFLPAGVAQWMDDAGVSAIAVGKYGLDIGRVVSTSVNSTYRFATGAKGQFDDNWSWDFYYQYGHDHRYQSVANDRINTNFLWATDVTTDPSTGDPICRILLDPNHPAGADGCVPFDIFGPGNFSDEAKAYAFGTIQEFFSFNQHVVSGNVQGTMFNAPGGPVKLAGGLEYRYENGRVWHDDNARTFNYWLNYGDDYAGSVGVTEGYVETDVPLFSDLPFMKLLEFDAAARQTHYKKKNSVTGESRGIDATTWKISAIYDPSTWLRLRATRSRDIRAPNFQELYSRNQSQLGSINNPFNNTVENPVTNTGGNVNLQPELGNTYTMGAVFQPGGFAQGFRFSADYWHINIKSAIGTTTTQNIVDQCYAGFQEFCNYLTFDNMNNITAIQNVDFNLQSFKLRGMDFEALYPISLGSLGDLTIHALATYTIHLLQDTGVLYDYAGQTGGGSGVPHWIGTTEFTFHHNALTTTLQGRFIEHGIYNVQRIGPDDPNYSPTLPNSINNNRVSGRVYINLTAQYDVPLKSEHTMQIYGTINNLFNRKPPLAESTSYPTNPTYFDQIGIAFRVGVRMRY